MAKFRLATATEIEQWDDLVRANPDGGHIYQSKAWGDFKATHGWQPQRYIYSGKLAVQFLSRQIPGLGALWYCLRGPGVANIKDFTALATSVQRELKGPFQIIFDPALAGEHTASLIKAGLQQVGDIQLDRATIVVDLTTSEDDLLARFKPKTRYNIRLSQKRGVSVEPVEASDENLETMWQLYRAMMARTGFFMRTSEYFKGYWQEQAAAGQGQLFLAYHEGTALAGAYVTYFGGKGWYKDGGSSRDKSELMAPHLVQWEAMRWLRAKGIKSYDLVAVPPKDSLSPEHSMYGLYRFKSGFNSEITEYIGTWSLALDPIKLGVWRGGAGRLYAQYLKRLKKELLY